MKPLLPSAVACLAIMSVASPLLAANDPLRLPPSSKWHLDYGPDHCRLARQFGEDKSKTFIFLDKFGPGEEFRLTVAGRPVQTSRTRDDAWVQFGPNEAKQPLTFMKGSVGPDSALLFSESARVAPPSDAELKAIDDRKDDEWIDLAPIDSTRLSNIRYLQIGKPLRQPVVLETGAMQKPMEALDKCVNELVGHWGIDVEKHKSLTRKPKPTENPGKWVISSDYPLDMLEVGQPALVEFRLNVGTDGKPTACHIQSTTRPKEFDDAVCKSLLRRAEFEPALDAEGKPLASYWRSRVRFQLPGG